MLDLHDATDDYIPKIRPSFRNDVERFLKRSETYENINGFFRELQNEDYLTSNTHFVWTHGFTIISLREQTGESFEIMTTAAS